MTISLNDFNNLSDQEKKETLQQLKSDLGVSGIVNAWGISRSKVYSMLSKFDISLDSKKGPKAKAQKPKISFENKAEELKKDIRTASEESRNTAPQELSVKDENGSNLSLEWDDHSDDNKEQTKFSLYLDTQGTGKLISQTLQMLLGSEHLSNTDIHLNITIQEM